MLSQQKRRPPERFHFYRIKIARRIVRDLMANIALNISSIRDIHAPRYWNYNSCTITYNYLYNVILVLLELQIQTNRNSSKMHYYIQHTFIQHCISFLELRIQTNRNSCKIDTPSAAARRRQMSHKIIVPVLPTPALLWTTTGPSPGDIANSFFKYVTTECMYNGTQRCGQVV